MTKTQARKFLEKWSGILCPEWEITIAEGPSPHIAADEHLAAINRSCDGEYLRATISLHEVLSGNLTKEEERRVLLHELLHLTVTDLEHAANEPTKALSYDAGRLARENIERYIERTVDRLASAFESVTA